MSRSAAIDLVRGPSIIAMMFVHTSAWYLSNPTAFSIWNFGQFAVPAFVFCSSYLFFKKKDSYPLNRFWQYAKKRLPRLLIPYWFYLVFYFILTALIQPKNLNLGTVLREVTLTTSGLEVNWAVLLFIELTLLMPLLNYLQEKRKGFFFLYLLIAFGASGLLIVQKSPVNFRLIMWLPWSIIVLYSWLVAAYENKNWLFPAVLFGSGISLYFFWVTLQRFGLPVSFFHNKYPPTLYYLMWGVFSTTLIYLLAVKGFFNMTFFKKIVPFFSIHSYSLFFIHFLVIFFINSFFGIRAFNWGIFSFVVIGGSILLQLLLNTFTRNS